MSVKTGVKILTDDGSTAYPMTHASKVLYPSATSPNGTTTLAEAMSGASIRIQTGLSLEDEDFYDPVVDPLVKSYIDSLMAQFISEMVTVAASDWSSDLGSGYYKATVAITGMAAGTYPTLALIPANGTYATATENTDFKKIISTCAQENSLVIYATTQPTGSLKLLIKGILDYTGLTISLKDLSSRIGILESIPSKRTSTVFVPAAAWTSGYQNLAVSTTTYVSDTIIMNPSYSISSEQYVQYNNAHIVSNITTNGYVQLRCVGVQPTIDIPIRFDFINN